MNQAGPIWPKICSHCWWWLCLQERYQKLCASSFPSCPVAFQPFWCPRLAQISQKTGACTYLLRTLVCWCANMSARYILQALPVTGWMTGLFYTCIWLAMVDKSSWASFLDLTTDVFFGWHNPPWLHLQKHSQGLSSLASFTRKTLRYPSWSLAGVTDFVNTDVLIVSR